MKHDEILELHLGQLAKSVSPVYGLLAALKDDEARREGGRLADLIIGEQLTVPKELCREAAGLRALRLGVEAAKPDRKCIEFILSKFSGWFDGISSTGRETFVEVFPRLAPAARDLGDDGMRMVIETVNLDAALLAPIASYAMTTGEAIRAIAKLANRASDHHRADLIAKLVEIFPAEKMEVSREAERVVPAVEAATEAAATVWVPAMELALALITRDFSSAVGTLGGLPGAIGKVPVKDLGPYLDDFRMLVEEIGLSVNGICLQQLPGWYVQRGSEATRAHVALACEAARAYGALAGRSFLEGRTEASRQVQSSA